MTTGQSMLNLDINNAVARLTGIQSPWVGWVANSYLCDNLGPETGLWVDHAFGTYSHSQGIRLRSSKLRIDVARAQHPGLMDAIDESAEVWQMA